MRVLALVSCPAKRKVSSELCRLSMGQASGKVLLSSSQQCKEEVSRALCRHRVANSKSSARLIVSCRHMDQ